MSTKAEDRCLMWRQSWREIYLLEKDLTLGNFEAGKSGTIDFVVTPKKPGR